jgi:antitoxin CcdA
MVTLYDVQAPKKATNLSVNSDLLKKAKALDINLSAALEQALEELVKTRQKEAWLKENHEAIEKYNKHVDEYGVFSDGLRNF